MSDKRKSIGDALRAVLSNPGPTKRSAERPVAATSDAVPKSRQGRRGLLTYHHPMTIKQLQELALEQDTSQQKLVAEALNLLFAKYRKRPIA